MHRFGGAFFEKIFKVFLSLSAPYLQYIIFKKSKIIIVN